MQPLVKDRKGTVRFRANEIVKALLEFGELHGYGLNMIAVTRHSTEDYEQLLQLVGYSVSGFGDCSEVRKETVRRADRKAQKL